ncbi:MAG: pantoate--beta-alanine ligase [Candidatus Fonsibacter sp.]|nr:pantoate--beta-alanine ligase [Candidatus Fonsibacter sp.]
MKIIKTANKITSELLNKKKIGFIPTMGCLHDGHVSLIRKSKKKKLLTIVSIFVNPFQFNNKKDFKKYPKTILADLKICKKNKVNYVYLPQKKDIYPEKKIIIRNKIHFFKNYMEGKFRPGHFEGVVEVIKRLLTHIKTNYLFLGKKDYQQLIIIKKYLDSINSKIKIVPCDTIRSKNGIALSSRNKLLDHKSLNSAGKIFRFLKKNKKQIIKSKNNLFYLKKIKEFGANKIDYLSAFNLKQLKRTDKPSVNTRVFLAYHLNKVRLIDNF